MFEDTGTVRRTPPAPPPPLPEPEAKPLFAPGPPRAPLHDEPEPGHSVTRTTSRRGTGSLPPVWGPDVSEAEEEADWGAEDSGRDWLRLAGAVGVIVLLVFAVVFAFNLGRGSGGDPSADAGDAATSTAPPKPLAITGISDLDPPPSGNGEENPDLAPLAIDGDPGTAWQTMEYYGNPKFGLLKDGVGLVLDLGRQKQVSSVQVTLGGRPTSLDILAAPEGSSRPTGVDSLRKVASADGVGGRTTLQLSKPVTTQYLVVWLTSLPPEAGAYRGRVSEITVKG